MAAATASSSSSDTPRRPRPRRLLLWDDANWAGVTQSNNNVGQAMALGEATLPINFGFTPATPRPNTSGFGSMHTGGCQFLMGDGAVRFVSQNVDMTTYRNLSRVSDGQIVGEF